MYRSVILVAKDAFKTISSSIGVIDGLGPQEKSHMGLKQIAINYLDATYQVRALSETYFAGLHPDVRSADGRYIVECGTTDPSCVLIYLDDPLVEWIGNIPYPFADETHLRLHIFYRGNGYRQWRQESLAKNRAIFDKYHRK